MKGLLMLQIVPVGKSVSRLLGVTCFDMLFFIVACRRAHSMHTACPSTLLAL